jgi:integrase
MRKPMSMTEQAREYVAYRRALGFQFRVEGGELLRFAAYADSIGHRGPVSTELALRWAQRPQNASSLYRARRLEVVRCFARYQSIFNPDTEIPPSKILGPAHCRTTPYIYSEEQICALIALASHLSPVGGLRPRTYSTLFGLLASTGLRISEALRLECDDIDLMRGILRIRETKFRKSRLAPLAPSVVQALRQYGRFRDAYHPHVRTSAFLLGESGRALHYSTVRTTFRNIVEPLGWKTPEGNRPRLYDFRHTFVCRVLLRWYQQSVDVNQAMAALATYVGHVKPTDTYWYITGTPELLEAAADRFERFAQDRKGERDETKSWK